MTRTIERPWRWVPALSLVWLVACGGGGGGDEPPPPVAGPPAVQATLLNSPDEAAAAASAGIEAAADAVARSSAFGGLALLLGDPFARQPAQPSAARKRPLVVETASCFELLESPCNGSATLDTNASGDSSTVPAGTYIDITFNALAGSLAGQQFSFNGRQRMDFRAAFNLEASTLAGLDVDVTITELSVVVNGADFGTVTDAGRLTVDAAGVSTLTTGSRSYSGLDGVQVDGADDYRVDGGTVRIAYWSDSGRHVDIELQNWQVVNGRPTVGSRAVVRGAGGTLTLLVSASSSSSVVLAVTYSNGSSTAYVVTASYPPDGGAPTFVAVPG